MRHLKVTVTKQADGTAHAMTASGHRFAMPKTVAERAAGDGAFDLPLDLIADTVMDATHRHAFAHAFLSELLTTGTS